MTDSEAVAMRAYMQKGGFVIVDDFKPMRRRFPGWSSYDERRDVTYGSGWTVLETYMKRVMPGARFYDLIRRIPSSTRFSRSTISTSCRKSPASPAVRPSAGSSRTTIRPSAC